MRVAIIENKEYVILDTKQVTKKYTKLSSVDKTHNIWIFNWTSYTKDYWHVTVQMVNPVEERERVFVLSETEYKEVFK